jgi:methanogenic corrinoid protein MtbC1
MVMSQLRTHFQQRPPRGTRVLSAAAGGDLHALGVRMVSDFFEMEGWEAMYLGANTPADAVVEMVASYEPDLLALSATSYLNLRSLAETVFRVKSQNGSPELPVIVGGPPFNRIESLWENVGADGSAPSGPDAVKLGNQLVPAKI